jgi:8-amino-7-oxononanoate synthase
MRSPPARPPSPRAAPVLPARAWPTAPIAITCCWKQSWRRFSTRLTRWCSPPVTRPTWARSPRCWRPAIRCCSIPKRTPALFDGCRLSGADIFRFKHNDADSLASRLRRLGERASSALIVAEGLYSIRGDCAPLAEFAAVKREFGACLFVDEAHSLGLYGAHGRGLVEQEGVEADTDFIVGTFSKSLGSIGGFCVSKHPELALFRYASRPYIFTASPCPSVIATTRVALHKLGTRPELRDQVWANAHHLYGALAELGLDLGPHVSPVVGISFRERETAFGCWQGLFNAGVYTNLILPPAAPDGGSLIRCSVTAAHTPAHIDAIISAFDGVCRELRVGRYAAS